MSCVEFNQDQLHDFLKEFDYIKQLYPINDEAEEFYMLLAQYEESRQFAHMVKRDHSLTYDNVKLIYNNTSDDGMRIMELYEFTRHKIVEQFLNITGTEKLFSEKYFDFEWDMHTRIRYDESKHDFYRDHFIHQIRDMFEILSFLDNDTLNFSRKIENIIMNNQTNKVCRYMYNKATAHVDYIKNNRELFSTLTKLHCNRNTHLVGPVFDSSLNEFLLSHSLKQLTKKSCVTTALFHDIGYPVEHTLKINERITDYISLVHSLNEANINFNRIFTLLETSLLFEIVSKKEIIERLNKKNHGALSAIIFLLHFYESETIKPYSPLEEAVIEISALAIYNHTLDYSVATGEKEYYVNAVFNNNPVSSLFRLCDDIQEWDRVYFDYKNNTEIIICDICKTPIIKTKIDNSSNDKNSKYLCKCNTSKEIQLQVLYNREPLKYNTSEIFKRNVISDIKTTKISIVKICNEVKVRSAIDGQHYNTIEIEYLPYTLLQMARVDANFSKYRCNDLKKLKLMIRNQIVADNGEEFFIDYFLSSNPILIKAKILYDFFMESDFSGITGKKILHELRDNDDLDSFTNKRYYITSNIDNTIEKKVKSIYIHNNYCNFCDRFDRKTTQRTPPDCFGKSCSTYKLYQSINKKIALYMNILCYWLISQGCTEDEDITDELNTFWTNEIEKKILPRETTQLLLKYCKKHIDMYVDVQRDQLKSKQYFKLFCFDKKEEKEEYIYYNSISKYCEPSLGEYEVKPDSKFIDLDYYTDLLFFYEIKEEIIRMKEEKKIKK